MFTFIENISFLRAFFCSNSHLLITFMDGSVSLISNDITVKWKQGVNLINDFLELYGEDYTTIETIKGESLAKIPSNYIAIPSTISEKGAIVAYDFDFKGTTTYYRYAEFDFRTQSVGKNYCTERLPGGLILSNPDLFVFKTKENLWAFSLKDQNELWHFDVTEPGRYREWYPEGPERPGVVTKFLGVWQRRLYVAVSNGLIIELELESGRLLRSWQQLPDGITLPPSGWNKLHGLELAFLDAAAGEIACVTHQYYWHIDLESGALHFHDLREHFSAAQLQVSPPAGDPAFDAEHIYFASEFHQYDGQTGANVYQLAALHRRSARIVWQQRVELPQSCQWKQHPVLDGRRLYALSHDLARSSEGGTLHIFERTE